MRPDEHKQRASRRYQSKHKQAGDSTATEVAKERREKARAARGRGGRGGGVDHGRGGGDQDNENEEGEVVRKSYSRRKLASNNWRYEEKDAEEEEDLVDAETGSFLDLIEGSEDLASFDPERYFQFKEEKALEEEERKSDDVYLSLMQLRFEDLESSLYKLTIYERLRLDKKDIVLGANQLEPLSTSIVPKTIRTDIRAEQLLKKAAATSIMPTVSPASASTLTSIKHARDDKAVVKEIKITDVNEKDANDIDHLFQSGSKPSSTSSSKLASPKVIPSSMAKNPSLPKSKSPIKATEDEDFDKFMDEIDKATLPESNRALSTTPTSAKVKLPLPKTKKPNPNPSSTSKTSGISKDEEWLDDILG